MWSRSVVSNSWWPHGLQPTRLLPPWDSPGKSTGVACHFLLQGLFLTQGSNPGLLHSRQMLWPLSHQGSMYTILNSDFLLLADLMSLSFLHQSEILEGRKKFSSSPKASHKPGQMSCHPERPCMVATRISFEYGYLICLRVTYYHNFKMLYLFPVPKLTFTHFCHSSEH